MHRSTMLSEVQAVLFSVIVSVWTIEYAVYSDDGCCQYKTKRNVTIDTDHCLWENYTEPKPKRFCLEYCINNNTCTGVVVIDEGNIRQCCFLQEILYKKPGDQILFHVMNATLQCKKGWSGTNCDACAQQWSGANCDACAPHWAGDDCDACADGWLPPTCDQICDGFGCCNQGECQECIQNGRWEGLTGSGFAVQVDLTFSGSRCSDLVPGTAITVMSPSTITGGTLDEGTKILSFSDGAYTYEGTVTDDKSFNGICRDVNDPNFQFPFSLNYTYSFSK